MNIEYRTQLRIEKNTCSQHLSLTALAPNPRPIAIAIATADCDGNPETNELSFRANAVVHVFEVRDVWCVGAVPGGRPGFAHQNLLQLSTPPSARTSSPAEPERWFVAFDVPQAAAGTMVIPEFKRHDAWWDCRAADGRLFFIHSSCLVPCLQ
jgi:hypothetical protein